MHLRLVGWIEELVLMTGVCACLRRQVASNLDAKSSVGESTGSAGGARACCFKPNPFAVEKFAHKLASTTRMRR